MQMIDQHVASGTGVTVAALPVPREDATAFGVIQTGKDGRTIEAFLEKPADPPARPGHPDEAFASMGNYVFTSDALVDALRKDAADDDSRHDMGRDIIPMLMRQRLAEVYDFLGNEVPGAEPRDAGYWRDVGTLDSYFDAHMDLCAVQPVFNLYNEAVADPHPRAIAAAGQVRARRRRPGRAGHRQHRQQRRHRLRRAWSATRCSRPGSGSTAGPGSSGRCCCITPRSAGTRWSRTRSWTRTWCVPEGAQVGVDKERDRARGFTVSAGGITVVGKGQEVPP